jgi:hypothetical protein
VPVLRCAHCGVEFQGERDERYPKRYCSKRCVIDSQRTERHPCAYCGKPVVKNWLKHCSVECGRLARTGRRTKLGNVEYERNREVILATRHRDYAEHPEKQRARALARRHTPDGICEVEGCGKPGDRHHDDYGRPLDVRYLCRPHHIKWHKDRARELARA